MTAAGSTKGAFSLTADGQASYKVPIWNPPGRMGLEPGLSLAYNSGAGSGYIGVGWSLTGLAISSITRCKASIAIDGEAGPIDFSSSIYCLDGARLIKTPASSNEFRTENDRFAKIVLLGALTSPSGFTVYLKNGLILTYGTTDNARATGERLGWSNVSSTDSSVPRSTGLGFVTYAWGLDGAFDRVSSIPGHGGNRIAVKYRNSHPSPPPRYPGPLSFVELLPEEIQYNFASSGEPRAKLKLIYGRTRDDATYAFLSGFGLQQASLLTRIEALGPNPGPDNPGGLNVELLRSYDFVYDTGPTTGRTRLSSVTECDQFAAECKKPTIFSWHDGSTQFEDIADASGLVPNAGSLLWVRDIDGDGRDDIAYNQSGSSNPAHAGVPVVYRPTVVNGSSIQLSATEQTLLAEDRNGWLSLLPRIVYLADLDWDGKADLAYPDSNGRLSAADPSFPNGKSCLNASCSIQSYAGPTYFADMDGDGLPELVTAAVTLGANDWAYGLNRGGRFGTGIFNSYIAGGCFVLPCSQVTWDTPNYMISLDGSGRQALLYHKLSALVGQPDLHYRAELLTHSGERTEVTTTLRLPGSDSTERNYVMIDVNGDGLTDALEVAGNPYSPSETSQGLGLALNTGAGFTGRTFETGPPLVYGMSAPNDIYRFNDEKQPGYAIADMNQDGVPDIVFMGGTQAQLPVPQQRTGVAMLVGAKGPSDRATLTPGGYLTTTTGQNIPVAARMNANYAFAQLGDFNGDGLPDIIEVPQTDPTHFHLYLHTGPKADLLKTIQTGVEQRTEIGYSPIASSAHTAYSDCQYPLYCMKRGVWAVSSYSVSSDLRPNPLQPPTMNPFDVKYEGARSDALRGWLGFAKRSVTDLRTGRVAVTTYDNKTRVGTAYPFAMLPKQDGWIARETNASAGLPYRNLVTTEYESVPSSSNVYSVRAKFVDVRKDRLRSVPSSLGVALLDSSLAHDSTFESHSSFAYDAYNNVVDATTSTTNGIISQTSCPTMNNNVSAWLIGACGKIVEKNTSAQGLVATKTTSIEYYSGTLLEGTVIAEPNGDDSVRSTTVIVRDPSGNGQPTRISQSAKITAQDPAGTVGQTLTRQWTIGYDPSTASSPDSVFPTLIKDPAGHITNQEYHTGLGVLLSSTDPNHVATSYDYDGFGRVAGIRLPGEGEIRVSYLLAGAATGALAGNSSPQYLIRTEQYGGGVETVAFNHNNDEIYRQRLASDGTNSQRLTGYSRVPRQVARITQWRSPSDEAALTSFTSFAYDNIGRPTRVTTPDNTFVAYGYGVLSSPEGTRVSVTSPNGSTNQYDLDEFERTTLITENESGADGRIPGPWVTSYTYGPLGLPVGISPPSNVKSSSVSLGYDVLGRRTSWVDPDMGRTTTSYNAFGDVVSETDAAGAATGYVRDLLGRLTDRQSSAGMGDQQTYVWDTAPNGVGKLASSFNHSLWGVTKSYGYDYFGRLQSTTSDIATYGFNVEHQQFIVGRHYDSFGRLDRIDYPAVGGYRYAVQLDYDIAGLLMNTRPAGTRPGSAPASFWSTTARTPNQDIWKEAQGSGVQTTRDYDHARGWLNSISSSAELIFYDHDANGNVTGRHDRLDPTAWTDELFTYTDLDMLHRWDFSSPSMAGSMTYSPRGDGTLGGVVASIVRPYPQTTSSTFQYNRLNGSRAISAVERVSASGSRSSWSPAYDGSGNETDTGTGLAMGMLGYSSFGLPSFIGTSNGNVLFGLKYDADGRRAYKADYIQSNVPSETFYVDDLYEMRRGPSGVTHIFYVPGDGRTIAQEVWTDAGWGTGGGIAQQDILYLHDDIIGSVVAISSQSGQNSAQLRYEPFGKMFVPANFTAGGSLFSIPGVNGSTVTRGFAFSEADYGSNVLNMRGRLYDPRVGRFFSPDPVRANPWAGAAHDGYAYAYNNPLGWTDPTGFTNQRDPKLPSSSTTGGLGWQPPAQLEQANQGIEDLTAGGPLLSGFTVGGMSGTFSAGPGAQGIAANGPVDDGPPNPGGIGASSPVGGNPYGNRPSLGGGDSSSAGAPPPPRSNDLGIAGWDDAVLIYAAGAAATATAGAVVYWWHLPSTQHFVQELGRKVGHLWQARAETPSGKKLSEKIQKGMVQRGWTPEQIDEAVKNGKTVPATNKANGNSATRYVHPKTGQSVVVDNVTDDVIHVGGPGFTYGPESGDLP